MWAAQSAPRLHGLRPRVTRGARLRVGRYARRKRGTRRVTPAWADAIGSGDPAVEGACFPCGGQESPHRLGARAETTHAVLVRYSVDRDGLVCFGDGQLSDVPWGARVGASVHEIAHAPPLISFPALFRQVALNVAQHGMLLHARTGDPSLPARRIGRGAGRPPQRRLLR